MPDRTIYAGLSPGTRQPMYTTPADARSRRLWGTEKLTYSFNQARRYAARLDAHGHKDWRVPTIDELNVLWQNRNEGALKGTFNTGANPDHLIGAKPGWPFYWSSTRADMFTAWDQSFADGDARDDNMPGYRESLRCVR